MSKAALRQTFGVILGLGAHLLPFAPDIGKFISDFHALSPRFGWRTRTFLLMFWALVLVRVRKLYDIRLRLFEDGKFRYHSRIGHDKQPKTRFSETR